MGKVPNKWFRCDVLAFGSPAPEPRRQASEFMRVAILGNAGSGKSSLSLALARVANLRVLDLDTVAWEPSADAVLRPVGLAKAAVRAFCLQHSSWVVEGCYANLVSATFEFEPKLAFLNPGVEACVANCRSRLWEPHKYSSPDEQEANLRPLLSWVSQYYTRDGDLSLQGHRACFVNYRGPKRELLSLPGLEPLEEDFLHWLRN